MSINGEKSIRNDPKWLFTITLTSTRSLNLPFQENHPVRLALERISFKGWQIPAWTRMTPHEPAWTHLSPHKRYWTRMNAIEREWTQLNAIKVIKRLLNLFDIWILGVLAWNKHFGTKIIILQPKFIFKKLLIFFLIEIQSFFRAIFSKVFSSRWNAEKSNKK